MLASGLFLKKGEAQGVKIYVLQIVSRVHEECNFFNVNSHFF